MFTIIKNAIYVGTLFTLMSFLASCSSDPFENGGKCSNPGEVVSIGGRLAICLGENTNYKYYFSGKYFDDVLLASKIIFPTYGFDTEKPFDAKYDKFELGTEELIEVMGRDDITDIKIGDLANFAQGDSRWDSLLEARAKFESAEKENDYLRNERFRLLFDFKAGKASREESYSAQVKHLEYFDGAYKEISEEYDSKLEVVRASIFSKYSLADEEGLIVFLFLYTLPEQLKNT